MPWGEEALGKTPEALPEAGERVALRFVLGEEDVDGCGAADDVAETVDVVGCFGLVGGAEVVHPVGVEAVVIELECWPGELVLAQRLGCCRHVLGTRDTPP